MSGVLDKGGRLDRTGWERRVRFAMALTADDLAELSMLVDKQTLMLSDRQAKNGEMAELSRLHRLLEEARA